MNKELEALLMMAAKGLGLGVVGVDPERAGEFGVQLGALRRAGELVHDQRHMLAETTGYYTPTGVDSLVIDADSPGDGWTRYSVARLTSGHTGRHSFSPHGMGMNLAECKAFLRGVIVAAAVQR